MSTLIAETDTDILELFLDGELDDQATDALTRRLGAEPALAAALEQLRLQREMRCGWFASLEATDAEARAVVSRAKSAARRMERSDDAVDARWRWMRLIGAAAALIVIGFMSGRVGWNTTSGGPATANIGGAPLSMLPTIAAPAPTTPAVVPVDLGRANASAAPSPASLIWSKPAQAPAQDWVWQRLFGKPAQKASPVNSVVPGLDLDNDGASPNDTGLRAVYIVEVRDASGRRVAVAQFNTQQEAADFIAAMSRSGLRPNIPAEPAGTTDLPDSGGLLIHD